MEKPNLTDPEALEIWQLFAGKRIRAPGRLIMLARALLLLQRVKMAEGLLETQGLLIKGPKMDHLNPVSKSLAKDLQILARMWITLGLNQEVSSGVGLEKFTYKGEEN